MSNGGQVSTVHFCKIYGRKYKERTNRYRDGGSSRARSFCGIPARWSATAGASKALNALKRICLRESPPTLQILSDGIVGQVNRL